MDVTTFNVLWMVCNRTLSMYNIILSISNTFPILFFHNKNPFLSQPHTVSPFLSLSSIEYKVTKRSKSTLYFFIFNNFTMLLSQQFRIEKIKSPFFNRSIKESERNNKQWYHCREWQSSKKNFVYCVGIYI